MERKVDMNEISDGKRYTANDMVRVGCNDCQGCQACCHGMGSSIVLDPLDIFRLTKCIGCSTEQLLEDKIELNVVEGVILPNLKLMEEQDGACPFLNQQGRCSIHKDRPGICRLFPLGRIYENGEFTYFLQVHECKKPGKTKVKVKKWLDTPYLAANEKFISQWHYFLKEITIRINEAQDSEMIRKLNVFLLKTFYMTPYNCQEEDEFYDIFTERLGEVKKQLYMD